MKIHLQSLNYELWNIVEALYTKSTTNYNAWSDEQKKSANLDAKTMNALFYALNKEEFNRVSTARSANQIWQILHVTHEGTNKVKESKISILLHRFELFVGTCFDEDFVKHFIWSSSTRFIKSSS